MNGVFLFQVSVKINQYINNEPNITLKIHLCLIQG